MTLRIDPVSSEHAALVDDEDGDAGVTTWREFEAYKNYHATGLRKSGHPRPPPKPAATAATGSSHKPYLHSRGYVHFVKVRALVLGFGMGSSTMMFATSLLIMYVAYDPNSGAIHELIRGYYAVFRAAFLACFWWLLFGVAQFVWKRCGVDYHAVLGIGEDVTYSSVLTVVFSAFILVFGCFIVFVLQLIAPAMFTTPARWLPLLALVSPVALLLWPSDRPPLFFFASPGSTKTRRSLVVEVGATIAAAVTEPTFLRTFIADVMCSMPKLLGDLAFSACVYATGQALEKTETGGGSDKGPCSIATPAFAALVNFLAVLPFALRLAQCLRQAHAARALARAHREAAVATALPGGGLSTVGDDHRLAAAVRRHLLNCAKYVATLVLLGVSIARAGLGHGSGPGRALEATWLCLSVGCTLANYAWDVVDSWGLADAWRSTADAEAVRQPTLASQVVDDPAAPAPSPDELPVPAPADADGDGRGSWGAAFSRLRRAVPRGRHFTLGTYGLLAAEDAVLRCGWAVYVSPHQTVVAQQTILLLATAELFRRACWAVVRVEWEHAKALRESGRAPGLHHLHWERHVDRQHPTGGDDARGHDDRNPLLEERGGRIAAK